MLCAIWFEAVLFMMRGVWNFLSQFLDARAPTVRGHALSVTEASVCVTPEIRIEGLHRFAWICKEIDQTG